MYYPSHLLFIRGNKEAGGDGKGAGDLYRVQRWCVK